MILRSRIASLLRAGLALLALVAVTSYAVEVRQFEVEVAPSSAQVIHWIDDDRIVFKGVVHAPERAETQYPGKRIGKLATLDLRTGRINWYEEFNGQICVDGGRVALEQVDDVRQPAAGRIVSRFWLMRGTPGTLERQEVTREYLQSFDFRTNCRPESELPPLPAWAQEKQGKEGARFMRLRPEHGFVELAIHPRPGIKPNPAYPVRIHPPRAQGVQGVPLADIFTKRLKEGYSLSPLRWDRHKGAYHLYLDYYAWPTPEDVVLTHWWLFPDGRVEEIVTYSRRRDWPVTYDYRLIPTHAGVFIVGEEPRIVPETGRSGLYRLLDDNTLERILPGRVGAWALSPDGCKLAVGNDSRPRVEGNKQHTLQVINLCKGEQK